MSPLKNKEAILQETACPKCGRRFKTCKGEKTPNCFWCEFKRYPHPDDPDYRDVAAARVSSGTYTKEQNSIYWRAVCKEDPMPQFPGFPEEFDIPRKEMKIKLVPLTKIPLSGTIEEFEESLKDWLRGFLSVSEVVYDKNEDIITLTVPDFIKSLDNPVLGLNLKYVHRFFATLVEEMAKKSDREVRFEIHFPAYPQFDFKTMGY